MDSEEALLPNKSPEKLRIVLLGKVGKGKTSSANTILGKPNSESSYTKTCRVNKGNTDEVVVVDTPGLFNHKISNDELVEEIKKSIKTAEPGPHVFLIVISLQQEFTKESQQMVEIICSTFGKNTLSYTMVLFTYGSQLEIEGSTIKECINANKDLNQLITQCNWHYHIFDNIDGSPTQVTELLQKIRDMVQRRGKASYYTAEMLKEAEKEQQQLQQQVESQEVEKTGATRGPVRTSALLGTGAGCLVGYFFGGGEMTSSLGAALGAAAGGVMACGTTGLAMYVKKHFKKCSGE